MSRPPLDRGTGRLEKSTDGRLLLLRTEEPFQYVCACPAGHRISLSERFYFIIRSGRTDSSRKKVAPRTEPFMCCLYGCKQRENILQRRGGKEFARPLRFDQSKRIMGTFRGRPDDVPSPLGE